MKKTKGFAAIRNGATSYQGGLEVGISAGTRNGRKIAKMLIKSWVWRQTFVMMLLYFEVAGKELLGWAKLGWEDEQN